MNAAREEKLHILFIPITFQTRISRRSLADPKPAIDRTNEKKHLNDISTSAPHRICVAHCSSLGVRSIDVDQGSAPDCYLDFAGRVPLRLSREIPSTESIVFGSRRRAGEVDDSIVPKQDFS